MRKCEDPERALRAVVEYCHSAGAELEKASREPGMGEEGICCIEAQLQLLCSILMLILEELLRDEKVAVMG